MAAARVNVPTVFVSGGPMLAGRVKDVKQAYQACLRLLDLMQQVRSQKKN